MNIACCVFAIKQNETSVLVSWGSREGVEMTCSFVFSRLFLFFFTMGCFEEQFQVQALIVFSYVKIYWLKVALSCLSLQLSIQLLVMLDTCVICVQWFWVVQTNGFPWYLFINVLFIDHCSLTVATGRCGVVRKLRGGLMCEARALTAEMWRSF